MPYAPEGATKNIIIIRRMLMERTKKQKRIKDRKNIHLVHNDAKVQKSAISYQMIFRGMFVMA
jgi:hypothetical protein